MPSFPTFRRETIWRGEPSERTFCVVGDVTGNGVPDIVIGARRPKQEVYCLSCTDGGTWQRFDIDAGCGQLEAGGVLVDINGNGRLDLVAGQDWKGNLILWWENPGEPGAHWKRRVICAMPANQSHDQFAGDFDGDGRLEVYFWNQETTTLFYAPVPEDPTIAPWPNVYPIVRGKREEGFAAADIDGDGRPELIAGQSWYKAPKTPGGAWERHIYAEGFASPRVAAGIFAPGGNVEIILAEGDASYLTESYYGRVARCTFEDDPTKPWNVEILHNRLADPHSLVVADFDGDGQLDLFVGELGDPNGNDRHPPAQRVYFNDAGKFTERIIDVGLGTHESKPIEIDGKAAIVCKSYRNVADDIPRTPDVDSIHLWTPET